MHGSYGSSRRKVIRSVSSLEALPWLSLWPSAQFGSLEPRPPGTPTSSKNPILDFCFEPPRFRCLEHPFNPKTNREAQHQAQKYLNPNFRNVDSV